MSKLSHKFKAEMGGRICRETKGIVLKDVVQTTVSQFVDKNHALPMVQFKQELAKFAAQQFIRSFRYHNFEIDVNSLADIFLEALRGPGRGEPVC